MTVIHDQWGYCLQIRDFQKKSGKRPRSFLFVYQRETVLILDVFQSDPLASSHKVMWEDQTIKFDGTPYFVLGQTIFDSRNGKDRKEACRKQKVSKSSINVSMYLVFTTNWDTKIKIIYK